MYLLKLLGLKQFWQTLPLDPKRKKKSATAASYQSFQFYSRNLLSSNGRMCLSGPNCNMDARETSLIPSSQDLLTPKNHNLYFSTEFIPQSWRLHCSSQSILSTKWRCISGRDHKLFHLLQLKQTKIKHEITEDTICLPSFLTHSVQNQHN